MKPQNWCIDGSQRKDTLELLVEAIQGFRRKKGKSERKELKDEKDSQRILGELSFRSQTSSSMKVFKDFSDKIIQLQTLSIHSDRFPLFKCIMEPTIYIYIYSPG